MERSLKWFSWLGQQRCSANSGGHFLPYFGSCFLENRKHAEFNQQTDPQIKKGFDKCRQQVTGMSLSHSVNPGYQSCFDHPSKKAFHFSIAMSYISLVMDLCGYRLAEALFLFPFACLPHPLPDPWGRNAFPPRLGSGCGALCKGRTNPGPCGYWPTAITGITWHSHHPKSKRTSKEKTFKEMDLKAENNLHASSSVWKIITSGARCGQASSTPAGPSVLQL